MKVLAIGSLSDTKRNIYTGQSVMFDGIVNELIKLDHDLTVVDIAPKGNNKTISRIHEYMYVIFKIFKNLLIKKFDIGYITTAQSKRGFFRDYLIIALCKFFKVKVIIHQYGANYDQLTNSLGKKGLKKLKKMMDRVSLIIVEGNHMKSQLSFFENHENKVKVIPNGLPFLGENSQNSKTYDGFHPFHIFYLSNLIWTKGYFDVLEAVNLLVNKYHRNIKCTFAGAFMESPDDPIRGISNRKDFDKFIMQNNLESVINYYPGLYGSEKDQMFASSHVFVLPTYYINEGQPVSIIEAMAYGCVPIVTEFRHIPMMVTKLNGCFVKPKTPDQIANAIIQLIDNPQVYNKKSRLCIQDYKEKYTFEKFVNAVLQNMQNIVNEA